MTKSKNPLFRPRVSLFTNEEWEQHKKELLNKAVTIEQKHDYINFVDEKEIEGAMSEDENTSPKMNKRI